MLSTTTVYKHSLTHNTSYIRNQHQRPSELDLHTNTRRSHEVIPAPLREERERDHDPQPPPVARRAHEAQPADVRGHFAIELDRRPDLLELVLDERVVPMISG